MATHEINVESRAVEGKGASRRLRLAGKIPAIVYGGELQPVAIQLDQNWDRVIGLAGSTPRPLAPLDVSAFRAAVAAVHELPAQCSDPGDRLYGHIVVRKDRTAFLRFLRYIRSWDPPTPTIQVSDPEFSSPCLDSRAGSKASRCPGPTSTDTSRAPCCEG